MDIAPCSLVVFTFMSTQLLGCNPRDEKSPSAPPLSAQAFSASSESTTAATPPKDPPIVTLDGKNRPLSSRNQNASNIVSIAMLTDVHAEPSASSLRVGALRAGAVVETDHENAGTNDCPQGWRKIKPFGFVCLGEEATTDLQHPIAQASFRRPDLTQKMPYMYGIVMRGGPVYSRIPTQDDLKESEPNLQKHFAKWAKDKENGANYGAELWYKWKTEPFIEPLDALKQKVTDNNIPAFLQNGQMLPNLSKAIKNKQIAKIGQVDRHNGLSFIDSFLYEGRRYNLTTDLRIVPADRFRPIRGSDFHGYMIGRDIQFPFALVRKKNAKRWAWNSAKKKLTSTANLEWRSAVQLTGKQNFFNEKLHYETIDGDWVDDQSAGRVDPAKKMPAWGKNGEKWIDVNITKQVLVAYEGTNPVFATLVSSGEAGLGDPETSKSTKRGIFRIHTKYITATMDSDVVGEEFELRDVPYVQYFENGYALHGAYWHDGFGQPKSHGCINLAPEDARRLFFWTEPQVPEGWHGTAKNLTGTVVFIHP